MSSVSTNSSAAPGSPRKRRAGRVVLIVVGVLVVLFVIGVLLVPTIVSSAGPGIVQNSMSKQYKGSVKVGSMSIGWFSGAAVGPVELHDPAGKLVAKLNVQTPISLWRAISQRMWSAQNLDVGTIKLDGMVDIERTPSGTTNLEQALQPTQPPAAKKKAGGGMQSFKGTLDITNLDINVRELGPDGKVVTETGVKGLKGTASVNYAPGNLAATADMTGTPTGAGVPAAGAAAPMTVKLDLATEYAPPSPSLASIQKANIKANIAGLPVAVVDAFAKMGGALEEGFGQTLDVTLDGSGNAKAGTWTLNAQAPSMRANLSLETHDNVLSLAAPAPPAGSGIAPMSSPARENRVSLRSLAFLEKLPQTRAMVSKIGQRLQLQGAAPGLEVSIEQLRLPVPAGGSGTAIDARNSALVARAQVGGMSGRVATSGSNDKPGDWKNFEVQPISVVVNAPDFSQPVTLTAGTQAMVGGQSAGQVSVSASAQGLLDSKGALRAMTPNEGVAEKLDANVKVIGLTTALVQPIVAGMGVPVAVEDIGPTVDAEVQVRADTAAAKMGGAAGANPPMDVTVNVTSQNIKVAGAAHIENNELSTGPEGFTASMASAAPLAQRILNKPGAAPVATLSGPGAVSLSVRDLVMPIGSTGSTGSATALLARVRGSIEAQLQHLSVQAATAKDAAPLPPVMIDNLTFSTKIAPGSAPTLKLASNITQDGAPVNVGADLTLQGFDNWLKNSAQKAGKSNAFDDLFQLAPSGTVRFENVPRSLLVLAPGLGSYLSDSSTGDVAKMVRGAVGQSASLIVDITPEGNDAQAGGGTDARLQLSTAAKGLGADVKAALTRTKATISTAALFFNGDPSTLNPVLAQGVKQGQPATTLAQPFKLQVALAQPVSVPMTMTDGKLQPELEKASDATVKLSVDNQIVLDNISVGADANGKPITTQVHVQNLAGQATVPVSGFASAAAKAEKKASFDLKGAVAQASGAKLVDVSGSGTSTLDGSSIDATFKLAGLDTKAADAMLQKQGYLAGALGDHADASVRITPKGKGVLAIDAQVDSPLVSGGTIHLAKGPDSIKLTEPASITWKPDPSFLTAVLFKNQPTSGGVTVTKVDTVTAKINQLAIATGNTDPSKGPVTGPMKPDVFAIDTTVNIGSLTLAVPGKPASADGAGGSNTTSTPLTMNGVNASVKQGKPGSIDAQVVIDTVVSGSNTAKKQGFHASIANLADANGVIDTKQALINADANLTAFPTPIIDQLAHQKGVLTEVLGPTMDLKATATNVSLASTAAPAQGAAPATTGRIDATLSAPRASMQLQGTVASGVFAQGGTIGGKVTEMRPELIDVLSGGIPVIASVTKTPQMQPAVFDASNMRVPIDGDMKKLNGTVKIDPGVASFKLNNLIAEFLTSTNIKSEGMIGQRIEPFVVNFKDGVATYDKFTLPIGTFNIETQGTVDLVQRQIDVVTYVPLMGLSDKALSLLNQGGIAGKLGVLDKLTKVPITTKGPLDHPTTMVDVGLFIKQTGDTLLKQPGQVIQQGIGNAIEDLFGKKNKQQEKKK